MNRSCLALLGAFPSLLKSSAALPQSAGELQSLEEMDRICLSEGCEGVRG